jgi:hypothetical protein
MNTDKLIDAADDYAASYASDDRECIKTDVINAFYAGAEFAEEHFRAELAEANRKLAIAVKSLIEISTFPRYRMPGDIAKEARALLNEKLNNEPR